MSAAESSAAAGPVIRVDTSGPVDLATVTAQVVEELHDAVPTALGIAERERPSAIPSRRATNQHQVTNSTLPAVEAVIPGAFLR